MKWRRRHNIKKADLETIWFQMCSDTLAKISRMFRWLTMPKNTQGFLTIWYMQSY